MGLSAAMSRRGLTRASWALLALLLALAAWDGLQLGRARQFNEQIAAGLSAAPAPDAPAPLRFAHAQALAASGATDAALNAYRALQPDPKLGQPARYNAANLLMRQAFVVRGGQQPGQAVVLIELAKEGYRDVLRAEPGHWNARYNLERAQRLLPELDEAEPEAADSRRGAERAATTMRGFSPGLP